METFFRRGRANMRQAKMTARKRKVRRPHLHRIQQLPFDKIVIKNQYFINSSLTILKEHNIWTKSFALRYPGTGCRKWGSIILGVCFLIYPLLLNLSIFSLVFLLFVALFVRFHPNPVSTHLTLCSGRLIVWSWSAEQCFSSERCLLSFCQCGHSSTWASCKLFKPDWTFNKSLIRIRDICDFFYTGKFFGK